MALSNQAQHHQHAPNHMSSTQKQHVIDPEICIRCYSCEMACTLDAIHHDDNNVVVDADVCNECMACIPVCPTGSIDNWRVVETAYSLEEQFSWDELPEQQPIKSSGADSDSLHSTDAIQAIDPVIAEILATAHKGNQGKTRAPTSAATPSINLYGRERPITARVQGNFRLTSEDSDADVRHIILDFGVGTLPVLEGQSIGIIPPGTSSNGKAEIPRLYSVSSPRDGERANYNNLSLTVKRVPSGKASNYICDLKKDDTAQVTGPYGSTFLMPDDPATRLFMICTGTGSAPFRAFTMRRQRMNSTFGDMTLFFGARTPDSLPYFGPLNKVPDTLLQTHLVFSRIKGQPKQYVQDRLISEQEQVAEILGDNTTHMYICGLRGMEEGVERAMTNIAESIGMSWQTQRDVMRNQGRYHVETY